MDVCEPESVPLIALLKVIGRPINVLRFATAIGDDEELVRKSAVRVVLPPNKIVDGLAV